MDTQFTQGGSTPASERQLLGLALRGVQLLPAGLAMCLPILSFLAAISSGRAPGLGVDYLLIASPMMALPFGLAGLWRQHTRLDDLDYLGCISAGLLTAVLGWVWLTVDLLLYPAIAVQSLGGLIWLVPTILCAMLLTLSLQRAIAPSMFR